MKISKTIWVSVLVVLVISAFVAPVIAFKDDRSIEDRLFAVTDSSAGGGIKGSIASPSESPLAVLAMSYDEPRNVYKASLSGKKFSFHGIPSGIYGLFVIYRTFAYEGLSLMKRGETSTLQQIDLIKINNTIEKSEKFFRVKTIHRLEGTAGRGNMSRALVTMYKELPKGGDGYGRGAGKWVMAYKLYIMKDVGPGWQTSQAKEFYRIMINPTNEEARPTINFSKELNRIRVSDYVKDVGEINLTNGD